MKPRLILAAFAAALVALVAACGGAARGARDSAGGSSDAQPRNDNEARVAALIAARDSVRYPHTEADVHFMSGMIPHHAQAVVMAGWAEERALRRDVKVLAQRIVVSQRDEIRLMQQWLRARNLPVPDSNATHHRMNMGGMVHDMLMPGMLNDEELARLRSSSGVAFDRLFLTFMIRHHQGAVTMVDELLKAPAAAQDETVFRFASDVFADQTAEIDRMGKMLASIPPGS
jgi:uncharacterized protein (DUF305 family)